MLCHLRDQQDFWRKNSHWGSLAHGLRIAIFREFSLFFCGVKWRKNGRRKEPAESVWAWFSFVLTLHYRTPSLVSLTLHTARGRRARWRGEGQRWQGKTKCSVLVWICKCNQTLRYRAKITGQCLNSAPLSISEKLQELKGIIPLRVWCRFSLSNCHFDVVFNARCLYFA